MLYKYKVTAQTNSDKKYQARLTYLKYKLTGKYFDRLVFITQDKWFTEPKTYEFELESDAIMFRLTHGV